jgi:soluble P-type ATPase
MLEVSVPGRETLRLEHLVLDFNGTLARDGVLIGGVAECIMRLVGMLSVHVVTGDTFGTAAEAVAGLPCKLVTLAPENQAEAKRVYVGGLGTAGTVCIGNGDNDRLMFGAAALAIGVIQAEGAAQTALAAAHIVCPSILDALDLLAHPKRIVATLRT